MVYVYDPSKLNISKYNKMCYFSVLMSNWPNKRSRISTKVDKQWREEHTQRFLSKDYSVENLFFSAKEMTNAQQMSLEFSLCCFSAA